jgi:hypothetical protein
MAMFLRLQECLKFQDKHCKEKENFIIYIRNAQNITLYAQKVTKAGNMQKILPAFLLFEFTLFINILFIK